MPSLNATNSALNKVASHGLCNPNRNRNHNIGRRLQKTDYDQDYDCETSPKVCTIQT